MREGEGSNLICFDGSFPYKVEKARYIRVFDVISEVFDRTIYRTINHSASLHRLQRVIDGQVTLHFPRVQVGVQVKDSKGRSSPAK